MTDTIDLEELRSVLDYDPLTGVFIWRQDMGKRRVKAGDRAGCVYHREKMWHVVIGYKGRLYRAHRLAWFYHYGEWPKRDLDHINGNRLDNRICNLRECTQRQNLANQRVKSTNTTGHKGVSFAKDKGKYAARIRMPDGKRRTLGYYDDVEDAAKAYRDAFVAQYGEFARLS